MNNKRIKKEGNTHAQEKKKRVCCIYHVPEAGAGTRNFHFTEHRPFSYLDSYQVHLMESACQRQG
jgi:hypothetical protein